MPLFNNRSSMLEVHNRALIKSAKERAEQIEKLERELQIAASQIGQLQRELQTTQEWTGKLERDLQTLQGRTGIERDFQQAANEVERLTLERDFYSKRASALEEQNRELSETATRYSLWGQKLERELARIDPDGAPARRFDAQDERLTRMRGRAP